TSAASGGRGPTRLMSPFSTFQSCGSSSALVRRRARPTRVMRGSSRTLNAGNGASFKCASWAFNPSAPRTIERYFHNRKRRPLRPTRSCRWNGGHPESRTIDTAMSSKAGHSTASPVPARRTSIARLVVDRTIRCSTGSTAGTRVIAGPDCVSYCVRPVKAKPPRGSYRDRSLRHSNEWRCGQSAARNMPQVAGQADVGQPLTYRFFARLAPGPLRASGGGNASIDVDERAIADVRREATVEFGSRTTREIVRETIRVNDATDRITKRVRVSGTEEETAHAVADDLGLRAEATSDHGYALRQCLGDRQRESLVTHRREDEHARTRDMLQHLAMRQLPKHANMSELRTHGRGVHLRGERPVADDLERHLRQRAPGIEQDLHALLS